jgi:sugar lactone lactonase YvrE
VCNPAGRIRQIVALNSLLLLSLWLAAAQAQTAQSKPAPASALNSPNGLALNAQGQLFISDVGAHRIFKLDQRGRLSVVAGTGAGGFAGDGGPATQAQLFAPHDLLFDAAGNLLIADTYNQRIRRIDGQGIITTLAGNGQAAYTGDGGPARQASLNNPQGLALDRRGNLLIADTYNHVVRRVTPDGTIATLAGSVPGHGGDGGPAIKAQINLTMAVAAAPDGSVYLSDAANSRIRRVAPDGTISTVAGFGPAQDTYGGGFAGDGGPAEQAKLFSATDLKCDAAGNLYLVDSGNHRVRVIRAGIIKTVAGAGTLGFSGDGGPALAAQFNTPQKLALAPDGSLYLSDRANHCVRKVDASGLIRTIAGTGKAAR